MTLSVLARHVAQLAPAAVSGAARSHFTRVDHAPPGVPPVYHGTSPERARSILSNGFDLGRTGQNYAGSPAGAVPYSVAGVYASTASWVAQRWGAIGNKLPPDQVALIALYPKPDPHYVSVPVPEEHQLSLERTRQFMAEHPEAHEFTIAHGESTEVLFTRRALEDPAVEVAFRLAGKAG